MQNNKNNKLFFKFLHRLSKRNGVLIRKSIKQGTAMVDFSFPKWACYSELRNCRKKLL